MVIAGILSYKSLVDRNIPRDLLSTSGVNLHRFVPSTNMIVVTDKSESCVSQGNRYSNSVNYSLLWTCLFLHMTNPVCVRALFSTLRNENYLPADPFLELISMN